VRQCQKIVTGIEGPLPDAIALARLEKRISLEDSVSSQDNSARDSGRGWGRWARVGEWVLFALLVARFGVHNAQQTWKALNNDFPDYFLTASLLHEHYDTSRVYEWIWLERQKDHRDIDQRIVNLAPSTPFSTLAVYPLTGMPVLAAKHCWTFFNVGLLIATLFLLRDLTQLPWRRLALVAALSAPLRMNFLNGQYYVLILFMMTLACYLYMRQRRFLAGVTVGIAAGMKIFPVIYMLYFLRKRDFKAFAGGVAGGLASALVSVLAFGWQANRTYLLQVLPATLRGEAGAPYALKIASLTVLLHRLFVYEPQLNPHPAIQAAWLLTVLHPVLQMAVMAPALLLAVPKDADGQRVRLEWAAILVASVAISTSPGDYLFTLLIFPACVVLGMVRGRRSYLLAGAVLFLYFTTGYLSGANPGGEGWKALLGVPRLYALILCCGLMYVLQMRRRPVENSKRERLAWAVALGVVVVLGVSANLRHQRGLYDDYRWRISTPVNVYMAAHPAADGDDVLFVGLMSDGYRAAIHRGGGQQGEVTEIDGTGQGDVLAATAAQGKHWFEAAGHTSTVESSGASSTAFEFAGASIIPQAEYPVASSDGRWLAFLREDHGRGRIWLRGLGTPGQADSADRLVTPPELNVLEMSFLPTGEVIFAADSDGRLGLFATNPIGNSSGSIRSLGMDGARYPAVSPDGHWLAYGQMQRGSWNLWLRDLTSGETRRLTDAECNTTEPGWTADSKTLIYASDCGRGLLFSALSRRRVVP
jgi:Glycosyltransferase family 87/WD40-like Beta Propeller Repeat